MQRFNSSNLSHPVVIRKVVHAMREALTQARSDQWADRGHGKAYVADSKGRLYMRVSWRQGEGFTFYGRESMNITAVVLGVLNKFRQRAAQLRQRSAFNYFVEWYL